MIDAIDVAGNVIRKDKLMELTNEEILLCDGFEEALIGFINIFDKTISLYDKIMCIEILMKRDGMERQDAIEFFEYNVLGSYVGEYTPAFATFLDA